MSTENNQSPQSKTEAPGLKRPFMLAYTVKSIEDGKKSVWSKIGAAWAHKDGQGFEVRMDAVPVDGRVVLRTVKDEDADRTGEVVNRSPS